MRGGDDRWWSRLSPFSLLSLFVVKCADFLLLLWECVFIFSCCIVCIFFLMVCSFFQCIFSTFVVLLIKMNYETWERMIDLLDSIFFGNSFCIRCDIIEKRLSLNIRDLSEGLSINFVSNFNKSHKKIGEFPFCTVFKIFEKKIDYI